jgi:hypothetical protein
MTAIAPGRAARPVPGPCLTAGPWAGRLITVVFATSVVLFLFGLVTLAS